MIWHTRPLPWMGMGLCVAALTCGRPSPCIAAEAMSLSLTDAVAAALKGNPDLEVARYTPQAAEAGVTAARGAFDAEVYVSAVDGLTGSHSTATSALEGVQAVDQAGQAATAGVARRFATGTAIDASLRVARTATNVDYATFNPQITSALAIQVTQPLLQGFGEVNRQGIVVASLNAEQSEEALRATLQAVVLNTCEAYWELVFRRQDLEVKAEALKLAEEQLARNQEQVRLGALAPVEMIQAEQAVASAEYQKVEAELQAANAEDALRALLGLGMPGLEWDTALNPTDLPHPGTGGVDVDAAIAVAMEREPTVAQARLAHESRKVQLDGAGNQRLPQLDLLGGFGVSGIGGVPTSDLTGGDPAVAIGPPAIAQQMFTGDNYQWSLGMRLSVPLRNYAARGAYDEALVLSARASAEVRAAEQAAAVAVRRAARQLEGQARAAEAAKRARDLAERQLEAEEKKFAMGTATNFQVLQFQRDLAQARTSELRALVDLEIARASLEEAKGTLLDSVGVSTAPPR